MSAYTDAELLAVARVVWPHNPYRTKDYLAQNFNDRKFWLDMARSALESGVGSGKMGFLSRYYSTGTGADCDEFCVRLALTHPERADEALGPWWSVQQGWTCPVIVWQYREPVASGMGMHVPSSNHPPRIVVSATGVEATVRHYLPPEFDAALQRARLIAAAWQRIEEASRG